ncbi:heavy-metal-associated domain-containing protein [Lacticaseibacillus rhamnosus]|uniref:heavy-metal-associated domain-containing protein n=1 Tax=Lacticaseibacillus rhamnosus TaxID=47715 RepID=UPI0008A454A3|nr:heavy-metal-associated domain-containing protein [Lacticaseibacillus rhamnosus]MDK7183007.1 heavy-metal-associated domain-containing protein [Lacticaseibacillus rhamnosus]MDK7240651.1 heavy-metal-associated domain-containing protein [Lacticaseibacillus rhamnosus]MDT8863850.1 heavy-metal-associated domain-containing protein [Lacticaseibacillus rhamnosus]OFN11771.1 heavy metal-binding protein [Lactobacillus sp. HMSC072E07]
MTKLVYQLDGLTCPSCLQKIEGALGQQAGVKTVKALFNSSKVKAQIDSAVTNADALKKTITDLGYTVVNVRSQEA